MMDVHGQGFVEGEGRTWSLNIFQVYLGFGGESGEM